VTSGLTASTAPGGQLVTTAMVTVSETTITPIVRDCPAGIVIHKALHHAENLNLTPASTEMLDMISMVTAWLIVHSKPFAVTLVGPIARRKTAAKLHAHHVRDAEQQALISVIVEIHPIINTCATPAMIILPSRLNAMPLVTLPVILDTPGFTVIVFMTTTVTLLDIALFVNPAMNVVGLPGVRRQIVGTVLDTVNWEALTLPVVQGDVTLVTGVTKR